MKTLVQSISNVKGIGENRKQQLELLGIRTIEDLFLYFPYRYEDLRLKDLSTINNEERVTVTGKIYGNPLLKYFTKKKSMLSVKLIVNELVVTAIWFNQPYIKEKLRSGDIITISGKFDPRRLQVVVNETIYSDQLPDQYGAMQPVYSVTSGIQVRWLRKIMKQALDQFGSFVQEIIPEPLVTQYRLMPRKEAIQAIHFPKDEKQCAFARRRLVYEELFLFQLKLQLQKYSSKQQPIGIAQQIDTNKIEQFIHALPFELTNAQRRVVNEILNDLRSPGVMNRLLQGDVGSGKTVVAAIALYATCTAGFQGALMVPTEILAEQHVKTLKRLLEPFGLHVALLTGSTSQRQRKNILGELQAGYIDIVVGTHALIQEDVQFQNLGLVITDEQHRFGVQQRRILREKGVNPDALFMTATPIPRTLAITAFGDMDISTLDELPAGRKPIETYWTTHTLWQKVLALLEREFRKGRQAYVICPLIEESEKMDYQNAIDLHEQLQATFSNRNVGLMHGKLTSKEKDEIMWDFLEHKIDLLVSTTVVEVGVDVPNASVMVIYDADRFGLAQLHQLRGRVGRGSEQSYCILVADPKSEAGKERMRIMTETNDGFEISRKDLEMRGPGDFFGTKQSGLPDFKLADLTSARDIKILEIARQDAEKLVQKRELFDSPSCNLLREYLQYKEVFATKIMD